MKTLTRQQLFTNIALFLLLIGTILSGNIISSLLRLLNVSALPASWVAGIGSAEDWILTLFYHWSFVLVGIVLIINRDDLQSLNIDEAFTAIFVVGSLTYWTYYRWPSGWIALLIPVAMYVFYKKREFRFAVPEPIAYRITIILAIVFLLSLLLKYDSRNIENIWRDTHYIATRIPFLLVEEVIFRGLLWKFLTNLNRSASRIIGLQAFLFWLSHSHFMLTSPIVFWIVIPIISVILGIIVWYSKSITVSLLAHIFYNFH